MMRTLLFVASAGILLTGSRPTPADVVAPPRVIQECRHSWDPARDSIYQVPDTLLWWTANIPEYNDCQRLYSPLGRGRYHMGQTRTVRGPRPGLFAVFAHPRLASLVERLQPRPECAVEVPACPVAPRTRPTTTATAAAWISADLGYQPLGIAMGANCLYLFKVQGQWRARMVPIPHFSPSNAEQATRECLEGSPDPRGLQGTDLTVREMQTPGLTDDTDYPPVTRWDWDERNGRHTIGLKCGPAWCEIGNMDGVAPSPTHQAATEGLRRTQQRVVSVKGWYDEQYLAHYDSTDHSLTPTDILGTIFPDDSLPWRTNANYLGTWQRVARVSLQWDGAAIPEGRYRLNQRALEQYKAKFNFDQTEPGGPLNTVSLCHGIDCIPDGSSAYDDCNGDWWAMVEPAYGGEPLYMCVNYYRSQPDPLNNNQLYPVPPVSRWRWMPQDEGMWDPCWEGCCEALGKGP